MTKYEIINELEKRIAEIDKKINALIMEKEENKKAIEELSSYGKS